MNHKSWIEERQIIQWQNESQVMNRKKQIMIFCLFSILGLWFILPLYYLSFFYSCLVVHFAFVLSVFLLFMTCGSFGHCIFCLSSTRSLWFIWPLYYLSFFCSWLVVHLAIALSVFLLFMTCGSFGHCIICLSSIHDLWCIWPLYYVSFFYSWLVVHLAFVLSVFLLSQVMNKRKTDNTMGKWTTSYEEKKDR
jgi:hypothetical protein